MSTSADWPRILKALGALGCLASVFAPLTEFSLLGSMHSMAPLDIVTDVSSGGDLFFAALIALAFLGPLGGATHAWLGRRPESLAAGMVELIALLYSGWFIYGFTRVGSSPTPFGHAALLAVAVCAAGLAGHLARAWAARRARTQ